MGATALRNRRSLFLMGGADMLPPAIPGGGVGMDEVEQTEFGVGKGLSARWYADVQSIAIEPWLPACGRSKPCPAVEVGH